VGLPSFAKLVWGLAEVLQAVLLLILLMRGRYRCFPALCAYLALNLLQAIVLVFVIYPEAGFSSPLAWRVGWISQGVVVASRAFAVAELCRHVLADFKGLWAFGSRLLALVACLVLGIAISMGQHDFVVLVLTLDLGVELAIASTIVCLFLFAEHYDLELGEPLRSLGFGFCMYSCVYVINDVLMQRFLQRYSEIWNLVGTLTFTASVALWLWAFLRPATAPSERPMLLDAKVYTTLIPEVNHRLSLLNEQLSRIWRRETHRT
jgi:hypothetical protein